MNIHAKIVCSYVIVWCLKIPFAMFFRFEIWNERCMSWMLHHHFLITQYGVIWNENQRNIIDDVFLPKSPWTNRWLINSLNDFCYRPSQLRTFVSSWRNDIVVLFCIVFDNFFSFSNLFIGFLVASIPRYGFNRVLLRRNVLRWLRVLLTNLYEYKLRVYGITASCGELSRL